MIFVVSLIVAQGMEDMMSQMMQNGPAGGGPPQIAGGSFGAIYGTMMTSWAVFLLIAGSIYPIVQIWLLGGAGVKAACRSSS